MNGSIYDKRNAGVSKRPRATRSRAQQWEFYTVLFCLAYVLFQYWWMSGHNGIMAMKEDVLYYQGHRDSVDYIHMLMWCWLSLIGYPLGVISIFLGTFYGFEYFFRIKNPLESFKLAFIAVFMTFHIQFFLLIGILSQGLSFMFFIWGWGFYLRQRFSMGFGCFILGCMAHPALIPFFVISLFFVEKRENWLNVVVLCVGFLLTLQTPIAANYTEGRFINQVTYQTSEQFYPWYATLFLIMNPIMFFWSKKDLRWTVFFLIALFLHNGRGVMFFIPFMIDAFWSGLIYPIDILYTLFLLCLTFLPNFNEALKTFKLV